MFEILRKLLPIRIGGGFSKPNVAVSTEAAGGREENDAKAYKSCCLNADLYLRRSLKWYAA